MSQGCLYQCFGFGHGFAFWDTVKKEIKPAPELEVKTRPK